LSVGQRHVQYIHTYKVTTSTICVFLVSSKNILMFRGILTFVEATFCIALYHSLFFTKSVLFTGLPIGTTART
jgi:hypothetical protein